MTHWSSSALEQTCGVSSVAIAHNSCTLDNYHNRLQAGEARSTRTTDTPLVTIKKTKNSCSSEKKGSEIIPVERY